MIDLCHTKRDRKGLQQILQIFIFDFLTIYFVFIDFYVGGHFEIAAILKILKTKNTSLSDDLFVSSFKRIRCTE